VRGDPPVEPGLTVRSAMSGFFHRPDRAEPAPLRVLGDVLDIAIVVLATAIFAVMCGNVFARAALNMDIAWNTEFGEFALVWATFLGGAAAARRGAHMAITEFITKLPTRQRRWAEVAIRLAVLGVLALLVIAGANIAHRTMDQLMSVLYWPVGLQYLAMPVGSGLAFVFVAYDAYSIAAGNPPIGGEDVTP